jgi:eukaryotic-like serine/threonine-protein kinase
VLDKYRIERLVGLGGMGVVMEARLLQLDERVAMKFLLPELAASPEAVARFEREAKVLFKIKSQHVCRVHEFARLPSGVPFIVMEYLEGRDLANGLVIEGGIPVPFAIGYLLQACHAVAEAHARGIVHRDLKPENFFVDEGHGDPCLKVLDFGLSKFADNTEQGRRERQLTAQQQAMGTPQYMAPEQWVSATDVGPAADQWALGAILFELLTGRPPFDADDIGQICTRTLNAPTPSVHERRPEVPPGLDVVIRKCLEKSPAQRYENVGALAVALAAFAPPSALAAAERLRAVLNSESDPDESRKLFPAAATRMPSMPSDLRPTMPRVPRVPEREQESWKRILARVTRRKRPSMALWMTIGSALTATVLLFVLLATQAGDPEAIAQPTSAPVMSVLPPETKAAEPPPTEPSSTPATVSEAPPSSKPAAKVAPTASASAAPPVGQPSSTAKMFERRW